MIKILIDSSTDIDVKEAESLGVSHIAIEVRFGDEEYLDGVNLSHREFFEKLVESDCLPTTSQINEFRFEEKFAEMTADGSEVIAISLSSQLSGTYDSACRAAQKFGGKVHVVDSLNACIGERILAEYAIKLVREGKLGVEEIVATLDEAKTRIQLLALLDTLEYLRKGGRISALAAGAGKMFSIKPVVSVVEGKVKMVGKAMGSKKGNNLLNQLVEACGGIDFSMPFAVGYSGLSDECLKKYIADSANLWQGKTDKVPSHMIGSTIGTHVGPGAVAVAFFAEKK